jgi:group II intron reverse transcriptase/maturase
MNKKFKQTNPNAPERWEDIKKSKTSAYPKNPLVSNALKTSTPPKTPAFNILKAILKHNQNHFSNNANPLNEGLPLHGNLMSIACSKELIRYAFKKLSKNKGALTPGTTPETTDSFSEDKVDSIHTRLKTNSFKWTPIKRIYIPKPGKTTKRPLGIPSFTDKIVQHIIMTILTTIYEPEFQYVDANYGFRPNVGCHTAIRKIRIFAHLADHAIEADIEGAYNNVDHNTLIKILRKRIKDEKFLNLIKTGLKSGILTNDTYEDSFLGTPQGGIASPILFNIYMNEFDKFIKFDLTNQVVQSFQPEFKTEISREYSRIEKVTKSRKSSIQAITKLTPIELLNNQRSLTEDLIQFYQVTVKYIKPNQTTEDLILKRVPGQNNFKLRNALRQSITESNTQKLFKDRFLERLNKELEDHQNLRLNTTRLDPERKKPALLYIRYADDWILFTKGNNNLPTDLKDIAQQWLSENLKLELSQEKTKITTLNEAKARFLGFEIFKQKNLKIKSKLSKNNVKYQQRYGTNIQIMPDIERLTNKFKIKNYINMKGSPISLSSLTVLEPHQIVRKFNQFMIGLGNYYIVEIDRPSALNKWHYFLYFCCIKTLAHKLKISVKQVITKYGFLDISDKNRKLNKDYQSTAYNRRIIIKTQVKGKATPDFAILYNYNHFMMLTLRLRQAYRWSQYHKNIDPIDFDYLKKVNWRTKFKLTTACISCGSTQHLENHHIRPLKNEKYQGFDKTIGSLNRKQVTLCRKCHNMVHSGKYDGMSLAKLYDVQLAIPETLLKMDPVPITIKPSNPKQVENIIIDHASKTYYNSALESYLESKSNKDLTNP